MKFEMVPTLITGILSVLMLVYAFFTSKEKGPILSNNYLFTSKEEREKIDKKTEYHRVSIVFGILGSIFLLITIEFLTMWNWLNYAIGILIIVLVLYIAKETSDAVLKG